MTEKAPDTRGVSTTVSYVFNLAIAAILVSVLLFGAGSIVEDQRQRVVREELRVVGHRVAAAIQQADRMALQGSDTTVRINVLAPESVGGLDYTITLDASEQQLLLTTENPDLTVALSIRNNTALTSSTIDGGSLLIVAKNGQVSLNTTTND